MRRLSVLLSIPLLASFGGCTFNPDSGAGIGNTGTGNGNGSTGAGAASGGGLRGGGTSTGAGGMRDPSVDGRNCGVTSQGAQNLPPDVLIVLDRSGSMANQFDDTQCPGGGGVCMDKWTAMLAALNQLVTQTNTTVNWGLKYFPSAGGGGGGNNNCNVGNGADVGVAAMRAGAIGTNLGMAAPGGRTPTRAGMNAGVAYLMGLTDNNPKFILLATDGLPNCAPGGGGMANDEMGAIQSVTDAATAGIPTFVVGIGNTGGAEATLSSMAMAGGKAQAAAPFYYPANNAAELAAVLGMIGGQVASCNFVLSPPPPVPENINILADGTKVPKDTNNANGWNYNGTCTTSSVQCSVTLYGSYCDRFTGGMINSVTSVYGCPGIILP